MLDLGEKFGQVFFFGEPQLLAQPVSARFDAAHLLEGDGRNLLGREPQLEQGAQVLVVGGQVGVLGRQFLEERIVHVLKAVAKLLPVALGTVLIDFRDNLFDVFPFFGLLDIDFE